MTFPINDAGRALLEEFEDFVARAYPDPESPLGKALQARGLWKPFLKGKAEIPPELAKMDGAPWTLGWGFTRGVKPGDTITRKNADLRLARELRPVAAAVQEACPDANENELAAMACFAWNVGTDGFLGSTVRKAHNRGDRAAAARAFALWNKSRGRVVAGLTRRRAAESALYLLPLAGEVAAVAGIPEPEPAGMPQRVDPESSMARSPIIGGSAVATGASVLGVAAESASSVRTVRDSLGDWLPWVLVAVAVAALAWVVWSRILQRRGGWA